MKGLGPLLAKEWRELVRTRRLLVVLVLYALVGLGSPLLARLMPELLMALPEDQLGGVELLLTQAPGTTDALVQYLKNLGSLPVLVVLLSMGTVTGERQRGTAAVVLSRPVDRGAFLLAKLVVPVAAHALGLLVAAGGCLAYTRALFGPVHLPGFLALNALMLGYLWSFLVVVLVAGVFLRSMGAVAAVGLGAWLVATVLGGLPALARWTPVGLATAAADLVQGRTVDGVGVTVAVSLGAAAVLLAVALRGFARQEV